MDLAYPFLFHFKIARTPSNGFEGTAIQMGMQQFVGIPKYVYHLGLRQS